MARIYIGVGHGGKDPGAVKGNRKEKDYNLKIATAVTALLKNAGHDVLQSRTSDIDFNTTAKIKQARTFGADVAMDIHLNAFNGTAQGTEVYYRNADSKGKALAVNMSAGISSALGTKNRGAKINLRADGKDYFQFIRENSASVALLVEVCFLDSDSDMAKLDINKAAQAIVTAILAAYPAPKKTQKAEITATKTETVTQIVEVTGSTSISAAIAGLQAKGYKITGTKIFIN